MGETLNLTIQINAETGQLEVVGQKMAALGQQTKSLAGDASGLLKSFLPFATAAGIIAFFTDSVKAAEEENVALRRLEFQIKALGKSWDTSKMSVQEWAAAIQASTRFSNSDAYDALGRLLRVTGDLSQAQRASQLSMSLSVASGKSLGETTDFVANLINKNTRALMEGNREFGAFTGGAKDAQSMLNALQKNLGDAAFKEEGLTKAGHTLKNSFNELQQEVGNALTPALTWVVEKTTSLIHGFEKLGIIIANLGAKMMVNFGSGWKAAMKAIDDETKVQFENLENHLTATKVKGSTERINVVHRETREEAALRKEQASKAEEIEGEINKNLAALTQDKMKKERQVMEAEIAARRQKINREITDERLKFKLLAELENEHIKRSQFLAKEEIQIKRAVALETAGTAIEALQVVNDMSQKDTDAQVIRAKAILALEKAIAIARILASPQAVLNPALAAAQVALTVAQFAQQFQAIDQAKSAFQSGIRSVSVSTPLPGGGNLTQISGPGSGTVPVSGGGGPASFGPAGSSGGGGGFIININANAIIVNGSVGVEDLADKIGRKIIEQIKARGQSDFIGVA